MIDADLADGVRNLLENCAEITAGERLLIVHEDPALGWYDDAVAEAVATVARSSGHPVTMLPVGEPQQEKPEAVVRAARDHDVTLFLARIGDQDRFEAIPGPGRYVMSYARDRTAMAASYGRAHHKAMIALKAAIDDILFAAERIEITCPLGTAISGSAGPRQAWGTDVTVRRFPLGVPQPVPSAGFSGRVALSRYLTPTGSQPYDPPTLAIEGIAFARVEAGRIAGFKGSPAAVEAIAGHYARVASLFGIDADCVHSWHAGIHPGCVFCGHIDADPDRWSNNIFTHPRFLHFHTCGNYAPGEICWTLADASVGADGVFLWEKGRLALDRFPQTRRVLDAWPALARLFAEPSRHVGLDA